MVAANKNGRASQSKHRNPQPIGHDGARGAARDVFQLVLIVSPVFDADGHRVSSGRGLLFDARLEGAERVLVRRTHQPFLEACRVLVADGVDPTTRIVMRHVGSRTDALIAKVGAAAKLSVKEDDEPPRFSLGHHSLPARSSRPSVLRSRPLGRQPTVMKTRQRLHRARTARGSRHDRTPFAVEP
jgi:hypothetical protein